jgi:hypothetical protein
MPNSWILFPTVDSILDNFIVTVLKASELSVPLLSTSHIVFLYHGEQRNVDAIQMHKHVFRYVRYQPTEPNLIAFKYLQGTERYPAGCELFHGKNGQVCSAAVLSLFVKCCVYTKQKSTQII